MAQHPVSRLAYPLTSFCNKKTELFEKKSRKRNKNNVFKSIAICQMRKFIRRKEFPERTWVNFETTYNGKTIKKGVDCFKNMDEFAYIMFSHNYLGKGRVSLSILVTDVDGDSTAVYNIADATFVKCYVSARGQPEPKGDKCYIVAVTLANDNNGNPDLIVNCFNR